MEFCGFEILAVPSERGSFLKSAFQKLMMAVSGDCELNALLAVLAHKGFSALRGLGPLIQTSLFGRSYPRALPDFHYLNPLQRQGGSYDSPSR